MGFLIFFGFGGLCMEYFWAGRICTCENEAIHDHYQDFLGYGLYCTLAEVFDLIGAHMRDRRSSLVTGKQRGIEATPDSPQRSTSPNRTQFIPSPFVSDHIGGRFLFKSRPAGMTKPDRIQAVRGNLESIYQFSKFLRAIMGNERGLLGPPPQANSAIRGQVSM